MSKKLHTQDMDPDFPQNIPPPHEIREGARTEKAREAVEQYLKSPDAKHLHGGEDYPGNLDLPSKTPQEIREEMDRLNKEGVETEEGELREGERAESPYRDEDQDPDVPQNIPEPVDILSGAKTAKAKKAVKQFLSSPEAKQLHGGEEYPGNLDLPAKTPEEIRQEMDQFRQRAE